MHIWQDLQTQALFAIVFPKIYQGIHSHLGLLHPETVVAVSESMVAKAGQGYQGTPWGRVGRERGP